MQVAANDVLADVQFDPAFLMGQSVDVTRFEHGNPVLPGTYSVDMTINQNPGGHAEISFTQKGSETSAQPCLTPALLDSLGINTSQWPALPAGQCVNLAALIPGASVHYDSGEQRLDISVPQASMRKSARGEVNPSRWDNGINAGLFNYNINANRNDYGGVSDDSAYGQLDGGFNVDGWRFRHRSTVNYDQHGGTHWQALDSYVEHDLTALKSTLTLGDSNTSGQVFDTFGVRGVQLASDDQMRPDSMQGFAPVVRGVARSNARVQITQNGNLLYQTTVPPGPFEINDINPTGYGGNLGVTVIEADGSREQYTVPYASVPQLLRAGISRYNFTAGRLRDQSYDTHNANVAQATFQHGFNNTVTGYAGLLGSEGYAAGLLGVAFNTPLGALALDVTQARTSLPGGADSSGQSWRVSFAKLLSATDTSISVAAYRYSSSGYYDLDDAVQSRYDNYGANDPVLQRQRGQFQLSLSQPIGKGSVFVTTSLNNYWNGGGQDVQFQAGYQGNMRWGSYNISAQRSTDAYGTKSNNIYLTLSIPIGGGGSVGKQPLFDNLSATLSQDSSNGATVQTSATGLAGDNGQLSYGINAGYSSRDSSDTDLGVNANYNGGRGSIGMTASTGTEGSNQQSLTLSGSVLVHAGGITLGQAVGPDDAIALVQAPGAAGATVTSSPGVTVDGFGYALVPYLTAYRSSTIELDPAHVSDTVELETTSQDVVPRAGAVVLAKFATEQGQPLVMRVKRDDASPLPMGADVLDASGKHVGVVGQAGTVFVRGVADKGRLTVHWTQDDNGACSFAYARSKGSAGIAQVCRPRQLTTQKMAAR